MGLKEKMMNKMMGNMGFEEKKEMMSTMMPKMMGNMMGGMKENPMMGMMGMMMGKKHHGKEGSDSEMPMEKCMKMMSGFTETANTARFATPELRTLFDEWCSQVEGEILDYVKKEGKIVAEDISKKFNLSEESVEYLLNNMASKKQIDYKVI